MKQWRKPQYLYGSTEAEVRRKLRDWKKQSCAWSKLRARKYFSAITQITGSTRSSSTLSKTAVLTATKAFISHHIKPSLGDIQIASIRSEEIQNLLIEKSKTLSYSVVKKINFLLSELFQYAHSEGDIAKNPMRNVKMPKKTLFKQKRTILVMEDEEVQAVGTGRYS